VGDGEGGGGGGPLPRTQTKIKSVTGAPLPCRAGKGAGGEGEGEHLQPCSSRGSGSRKLWEIDEKSKIKYVAAWQGMHEVGRDALLADEGLPAGVHLPGAAHPGLLGLVSAQLQDHLGLLLPGAHLGGEMSLQGICAASLLRRNLLPTCLCVSLLSKVV